MTHISELVAEATAAAPAWRRCTREQALVYACEDVAERESPARVLDPDGIRGFVENACLEEDIDVPYVEIVRSSRRCRGWAEHTSRTLAFSGRSVSLHTVVHEISHLLAPEDGHGPLFRNELVRLSRRHAGVEHASLLHSLFRGVGLDVSPWVA
ncbi:MAG: hypothetical protein RLZZ305_975 [Actinomycetota bacterium]